MSTDVIVVGGGIVGCATAYYLARRKKSVLLFERGAIASEQSGRAWGFVRQQGRADAEIPFAADASRTWGTLSEELGEDVEFQRHGILAAAETEDDEARLVEAVAMARHHGIGTRMVTSAEVASIFPELHGPWRAGLYTPEDGHAEPAKATRAFASAAERLGVRVVTGSPVTAIEVAAGAATGVVTSTGRHHAGAVLLAGGADSVRLARSVGVNLPIHVVRSTAGATNPTRPFTRTAFWGPKIAFRPRGDGSFYFGNGYRGLGADYDINLASFRNLRHFLPSYLRNWRRLKLHLGRNPFRSRDFHQPPESRVNQATVDHNEQRLYELFPHIAGVGVARSWAGRIDLTPDVLPIIGACGPRNFHVAAGFNGHGFALSPAIGRALAETLCGDRSAHDLRPFRPSRFEEGDVKPPDNVL